MIDTKKQASSSVLPARVSKRECADTGMAAVLVCLIAGLVTGARPWFSAAVTLLVLNMIWPRIYAYPARLWLGLSGLLGSVMSKVLLTVIFFGVQTPMAVLRRACGHDPMLRKQWKQGTGSVFVVRDHTFTAEEIERPY